MYMCRKLLKLVLKPQLRPSAAKKRPAPRPRSSVSAVSRKPPKPVPLL